MALFDEDMILKVWQKGQIDASNQPAEWRKDACGAWMKFVLYGNRNSRYGWEIDHIDPYGGDGLQNLQPLQWENNVRKGDGRGKCAVTANGTDNVAIQTGMR